MFHSLRARLIFSHTVLILLTLCIIGTGLLFVLRDFADAQLERRLTDSIRPLAGQVQTLLRAGQAPPEALDTVQDHIPNNWRALIVNANNDVLADSGNQSVGQRLPLRANVRRALLAGRTLFYVTQQVNATPRQVLVLAAVDPPIFAGLEELALPLATAGVVALFISLVVAIALARSISDPLRKLEQGTEEIARGNYEHQIPVTGADEVSRVAVRFNAMTQAVKRSQQMQKDFVANVSHELKTPLTSIKGFSQAIAEGTVRDLESAKRAAQVIFEESQRMARLVGELLTLARLEAGEMKPARDLIMLDELVPHWVERLRPRANEAQVQLSSAVEAVPAIEGDVAQIEQVVTNLVDNAIKYNRPGGTVTVIAQTAASAPPASLRARLNGQMPDQWALLRVTDTGLGIPQEHLPRLFERFYRADKARVAGGNGLGLAITQEIVRAHHGEIEVESEAGKGSTFTVWLPAK